MTQTNLCSRYDAVIVGSGIAGLLLALELQNAGMRIALICKGRLCDSNTSWAQGGVAICTGENPKDDPAKHLQDTLLAGAGLCDERVARGIIEGGKELFQKLESLGLAFDKKGTELELAREGGHCQSRVLHVKDASGKAISECLIAALRQCKRFALFEETFVVDLLTKGNRCIGLRILKNGSAVEILAPRVVLASGGLGQVFDRTTNPSIATGDGIAMAFRAGAQLVDMEFVQFHPTALYLPGAPASLITEAARGSGAHLLDKYGDRFAFRFHKDGELATRDIVSRAILSVMHEQNTPCVRLDLRPLGASTILEKYPNLVRTCRNWGIDPVDEPIPVSPAAHYFMGGIWTDENGRSSMRGLYALGECASTGLHGANRLASNSLLEGGVMALRVAREILSETPIRMPRGIMSISDSPIRTVSSCTPSRIDEFRKLMFSNAGLLRDSKSLGELIAKQARRPSQVPMEREALESANLGLLGALIASSAMARRESRGAHFRTDFPQLDDENFSRRYFVSRESRDYRDLELANDRVSPAAILL